MTMDWIQGLVSEAGEIWGQGGWAMYALAINGVILFALAALIAIRLRECGAGASADRQWARWRGDPNRARGPIARIIDGAMRQADDAGVARHFEAVRNDEMAPFERDLRVLRIAVSSAPLLGLLGTVTGMLTTFDALAIGGGGDKTMGMIAGGISEALITTETGLVMALAGLMVQNALTRRQEAYAKLLAHVETLCLQQMHRGGAPAGIRLTGASKRETESFGATPALEGAA